MNTIRQNNERLLRLKRRLSQILLILLYSTIGIACKTIDPHEESLSDYYWEIQNLRMQAKHGSLSTEAWRDLGVIYLRTGYYDEAEEVLSRAIAQDRSDAKLWFYAGLAQELNGKKNAALVRYQQAPTLSFTTLYNQAIKGRIAWLQDESLLSSIDRSAVEDSLNVQGQSRADTYAVLPLHCQGAPPEYAHIGKGLSELISRNLDQLRDIDTLDPFQVRKVERSAVSKGLMDQDRDDLMARVLGGRRIVRGVCKISSDLNSNLELEIHDLVGNEVISIAVEERLENTSILESTLMNQLIDALRIWVPNRERRLPLTAINLEALAAYSQGLDLEDEGNLEQSLRFYRQSLLLHPPFALAESKIESVRHKILAQGNNKEELIDLLVKMEAFMAAPHLVNARRTQLGQSMNAGITPGPDTRKLPPGNVGELPMPPRPTGN